MTNYGEEDARNYRFGLYGLQTAKLFDQQEQEERSRSAGTKQVLQVLPEARCP
jgi:hypothetical protein